MFIYKFIRSRTVTWSFVLSFLLYQLNDVARMSFIWKNDIYTSSKLSFFIKRDKKKNTNLFFSYFKQLLTHTIVLMALESTSLFWMHPLVAILSRSLCSKRCLRSEKCYKNIQTIMSRHHCWMLQYISSLIKEVIV